MKPLALAKLSRPRLHDVVVRKRLHAVLDDGCRRPAVWLAAQPGAGKTALVAGYLNDRRRSGIWYQVDPGDADAASFVYHLRLAADAHAAAADAAPLPLLTPEYGGDLRGFARRFFRALYARLGAGAALVLDNFQEVDDGAALHVLVAEAIGEAPDGVNVVVVSRSEPPAGYAGLLAADAIALVGGAELRLTLDETQAIAARRGVGDDARVRALHERSHGWAAGLTLLLTRTRAQPADAGDDAESLQHVFGYFAQRVFDGAAPDVRRALMQLAWLPSVSPDVAERLTGRADVTRLLEHFYLRHLFVDRRRVDGAGHAYQFHALFRAFLRHQAASAFDDAERRDHARRAAALLAAAGQHEAALDLYAEAQAWPEYARQLEADAEPLLAQGRHRTVLERLDALPAGSADAWPWLGYWRGRALMAVGADRALAALQAAYARFAARGDAAGQLACGAAVVQTLWYARLGWSEIAPWVDRLEPLIASPQALPTRAVEAMSYTGLHAALTFCRPAHAAIRGVAARLIDLVGDERIDWNQRLVTATHLAAYLHNAAELDAMQQLVAKVDGLVERLPSTAQNRAFWFVFRARVDLRAADDAAAAAGYRRARELAAADGLAHAEFAALQFDAYLDLLWRRGDGARATLARLATHPARGHADGEMHLAMLAALLAQLDGDHASAVAHAGRALAAIARIGVAYFQAVFPVLLVSVYADAGEHERALAIVADSRELCRGSYLEATEAQLLLEQAYVEHSLGHHDACRALVAQGFALAAADRSRAAYAHRILTRKPVLLEIALAAGIEVDYARQLARRWRLPPPVHDVPRWPWPVRVRTLGGFEVLLDDVPLAFGRKAPRKTLALLKALIARGGSVPDAALIDIFWPGEEGDAAARSLVAAVHRLRTLLGHAEAVEQQGGAVALDRALVWADAWAFERALEDGDDAGLALYRGAFLAEDEGEPWAVAMRERLRSKFVHRIGALGQRLEAERRDEEAIAWYLRGLDADPVVEPFYQGLMRCYQRLDRVGEALAAYRRLEQTLAATLALVPSRASERLAQSLRQRVAR